MYSYIQLHLNIEQHNNYYVLLSFMHTYRLLFSVLPVTVANELRHQRPVAPKRYLITFSIFNEFKHNLQQSKYYYSCYWVIPNGEKWLKSNAGWYLKAHKSPTSEKILTVWIACNIQRKKWQRNPPQCLSFREMNDSWTCKSLRSDKTCIHSSASLHVRCVLVRILAAIANLSE